VAFDSSFGGLLHSRAKQRTKIGNMIVDVTEAIVTNREASVTENPVEKGAAVTDHVRLGPYSLRIEGFISSAPTDEMKSLVESLSSGILSGAGFAAGNKLLGQKGSLLGAGLGATAGIEAASKIGSGLGLFNGDRDEGGLSYPQRAMMILLGMQEAAAPITIQTFFFPTNSKENIFHDMIITSLSFPQSAAEGDGLKFSLTARRIEFVSLQLVGVSADFIKGLQASNSATKMKDLGRQAAKKAPDKAAAKVEEAASKSLLFSGKEAVVSLAKSILGGG
jgi:hypothetical protein